MDTAVDVQMLTNTLDPIRAMYVAFRTCYSKFTPQQLWADIESGKISEEKMKTFIFDKLKSGHSSPRTLVFSSRRRHTRFDCDWSSDVCSSDLLHDGQLCARCDARNEYAAIRATVHGHDFRDDGRACLL